MKIYHTETQKDYDALMVKLEEQGIETLEKENWKNNKGETVVFVHAIGPYGDNSRTDTTYGSLKWAIKHHPRVPIIKYKAKEECKMKFTKENVEKVIDEYFQQADFEPCGDLIAEIHNLDDTPEKVGVPKFVADVFGSELHFEYEIEESRNIPHVLSAAFGEVSGNKNIKFLQWVKQHPDKYVMAVKFGYTIEPDTVTEQRYSVVIADRYLVQLFVGRTDYRFIEFDELCAWKPSAFQLTESEIKAIDERYWAFAVKVDETE